MLQSCNQREVPANAHVTGLSVYLWVGPVFIIIVKRTSRTPVYRTRWEHRALYENTSNTHSHPHPHPPSHHHPHTHMHVRAHGQQVCWKYTWTVRIATESTGYNLVAFRIRVTVCSSVSNQIRFRISMWLSVFYLAGRFFSGFLFF